MEIKTLYKTVKDGKTTVSPIEPAGDYTVTYRVVASEGAEITNGTTVCTVVDTDHPEEWSEITDPTPEEIAEALEAIL